MASEVADKLCALLRPFRHNMDGRWVQVDLSDHQLVEEFNANHLKFLPFQNKENEKVVFTACLVNLQSYSQILERQSGPSEYWPLLGLFKMQKPETLIRLVKIRSAVLEGMSWWDFLYDALPTVPKDVSKGLLEAVETKDFAFIRCYINVNLQSDLIIDKLDFKILSFAELAFCTRTMFVTKFSDDASISNALARLKDELLGLTIDSWMDLTEVSTKDLDSKVWWNNQAESFPSNYQLMIAHFCYEIVQNLPTKFNDLAPLLNNFAREYKREFELDLDNLEYADIVKKLSFVQEDWEAEAIAKHIMKNFRETMVKDQQCLDLLFKRPIFLKDHLHFFYENVPDKTKIKELLNVNEIDVVKTILELEIDKDTKENIPIFQIEHDLRAFINKVTSETEHLDFKDWLIIVFLNPKYVVKSLINEAMNHSGKIDLSTELLNQLPKLDCFDVPTNCFEFFHNDEKSDNAAKFMVKLSEKNEVIAKGIMEKLLQQMLQSKDVLHKSLKLMVEIQKVTQTDTNYCDILQKVLKILDSQKNWSVQDGECFSMISDLTKEKVELKEQNLQFSLPWLKPIEWNSLNNVQDILDDVIIILDSVTKDHQTYILQQLSRILSTLDVSYKDLFTIHKKVVFLISQYPEVKSLQNAQIQILAKILNFEEERKVYLPHLVSVLAAMPNCDAKKISLTKLKLISNLQ